MAEQNKFIKQIKLANDEVYDIATAHSITFKDGNDDKTGVKWNGLSDIEIVIPTITELIDTPVRFAGVVKKDGEGYYVEYDGKKVETFSAGDLVFFSDNISKFEIITGTTIACESGDMAVYDGSKWNVVTGEHQVSISEGLTVAGDINTATIGVNNATEVLEIEGKKLALQLNMSEIKGNLNKGGNEAISLNNGTATATVGTKYINIETDKTVAATGSCNIALDDKNVKILDGLQFVKSVTLPTISGGTLASGTKNETAITCNVSGGVLSKTTNGAESGDFVDSVDVSLSLLDEKDKTQDSIKIVTACGLTPSTTAGETFVKGIKEKGSGETANFVTTTFTDGKATYISSIGDYVSSVSGGSLKYNNADVTELLYGLGAEITDNSKGDVVYDVAVKAPTNVLSSATVDDKGVLSLVGESLSVTPKYKAFTKAIYTPVTPTAGTGITTGTLTKKEYVFSTGHDTLTTYSPNPTYKYLDVAETITHGKYNVSNIGVSIPIDSVVVDVNGGELPTIKDGNVQPLTLTNNIIGTVSDSLIGQATASVNVNTYKLTTSTESSNGAIAVGKEGEASVTNVTVSGTINLGDYYCE